MLRRLTALLLGGAVACGVTIARAEPAGRPLALRPSTTSDVSLTAHTPTVEAVRASARVDDLQRPVAVTPLDEATRGTAEQVGTTIPDPHPLPVDSGTGKRAVYSISQQFVWAVEADGTLARSFLVSGRLDMPRPGTYRVFSRSEFTCSRSNWNECMRWMVRFTKGPEGDNIGFHEIPRYKGVPMQGDDELGQPISSGCLRESTADAWFMWLWAPVGTTVVVVP